MNRIGIITDTNSGMTSAIAAQNEILLVPMPVIVDGREYFENVNLTQAEFFAHMARGARVSTSQPSPSSVMNCWDKALQTYDQLIYIPMSSALSSSWSSAAAYAQDYDGKVFVVDNRRISVSQKQSALDAARWRAEGLAAEEIVERLVNTASGASIYLAVEDLQYLKKGGRITPSVAAIGTVLNIKPVLQIQGGKLDTYKKVRGAQAAKRCLVDAIRQDLAERFQGKDVKLWAAYAGTKELGEAWFDYAREKFPDYKMHCEVLPISVSCHAGPGAVGLGITENTD